MEDILSIFLYINKTLRYGTLLLILANQTPLSSPLMSPLARKACTALPLCLATCLGVPCQLNWTEVCSSHVTCTCKKNNYHVQFTYKIRYEYWVQILEYCRLYIQCTWNRNWVNWKQKCQFVALNWHAYVKKLPKRRSYQNQSARIDKSKVLGLFIAKL